ncbi:ribulokinase [Bacillus sp. T33-2]|uniref:ribulokinase n=1 Tax=Bacillus sp. T33-2 TaxID=2054168 RepID=UPI000C75799B|nr:ribulokinase [Bacillus sp. T33-2]PLR95991.1 ribulokinase [Bacillus sp. T33-2]
MAMYVIGIDFGTESGRVLLVNAQNGEVIGTDYTLYKHGVMDQSFIDGSNLPDSWALQHPDDYLDVLRQSIPKVLNQTNVKPEEIIGIGLDFTASTVLPVSEDGTPLCVLPEWKTNPHSYVKLWKHHAAQKYADEVNRIAKLRGEPFLERYGGEISSEWMIPKILQVLREAPDIYTAADIFIEAGDWVVWKLTGNHTRNACAAGYKACWDREDGYPSKEFFQQLDPQIADLIGTKIPHQVLDVGTIAGMLTSDWAEQLGLSPNTAVSVATIDAHASVPAIGVNQPGQMVIAMGTSFCHMLLGETKCSIGGIPGTVDGGIIPGFVGYEAGQPAGGDMLAWYVRNLVSPDFAPISQKNEASIHQVLTERAENIPPGGTGLLALDWFNGNRSVLMDADLSGVIVGLTLSTKPEEIYRALLESIAFGTRVIVEQFEKSKVSVEAIHACGGVAVKNPLFIHILADVTGKEIYVNDIAYAPGIGAAMLGAVAAGSSKGGYDSIEQAVGKMGSTSRNRFKPNMEAKQVYDHLFNEYCRLHDRFGRKNSDILKNLKNIKAQGKAEGIN